MRRYEYAASLIQKNFNDLGSTTEASARKLEQIEDKVAAGLLPSSFQFTVHLDGEPRIKRPFNTKHHLGRSKLSFEEFFDLIHPQWWKLYLMFGAAAYRVSKEFEEELAQVEAANQIKIPLQINEEPRYVWYNQVSIPAGFDAEGRLTAHVNIYQFDRRYDVNHLVTGPLTVFGKEVRLEVGEEIQRVAQQLFYTEYIDRTPAKRKQRLPYLTTSQAKVLYLYRKLALHERLDTVTSETVARASSNEWPDGGFSKSSIMAHARDIRQFFDQHAGQDTPLSAYNFGSLREMAGFLNGLFGKGPAFQ
ncbi:hypothetical protein CEQ90_17550 [Lewinellaceae bacterium SD302]|nr:hypothetical protein CEQ90_17550 [Lewinellaceae bacterium SD302]